MKILAIHGSPRKGNSELLLKEALNNIDSNLHEIKIINPSNLNISGCTSCDGCKHTGKCIIIDDMDEIYPLLKDSHRVIISSPIFFFSVPAQLKMLIDRCQCLWYEKYVLSKTKQKDTNRKALILLVGGMKRGEVGVTCAEATLKAFLRTIDVKEHKTLSYLGYNEPGEIMKNPRVISDIKYAVEEIMKND